jgi:hypothetical protein
MNKYNWNSPRKNSYTLMLAILLSSSGCNTSESELSALESETAPLLVLSGGFGSCGVGSQAGQDTPDPRTMDVNKNLKKIVTDLESNGVKNVATAISCFPIALVGASRSVYYVTSDEPEVVKLGIRQDFYDAVEKLAKSGVPRVTHVIGHSYGGWNAMQLVKGASNGLTLASLTTIDPISPVNCRPTNIMINNDPNEAGQTACKEAPSDVTNSERLGIAKKAGSWNNFYQTDNITLHSSAMPEAGINKLVKYDSGSGNAHIAISNNSIVWDSVLRNVADSLKPIAAKPIVADRDIFLQLLDSQEDNQAEIIVAGREDLTRVHICLGARAECMVSDRVALDFEMKATVQIPLRRTFNSLKPLAINSGSTFTLIGRTADDKIVSAQSFRFASKE